MRAPVGQIGPTRSSPPATSLPCWAWSSSATAATRSSPTRQPRPVRPLSAGRILPAGHPTGDLQGIWNSQVSPPWNSQYTVNVNAEMNYWLAEATALADCHEPLLRMISNSRWPVGKPPARSTVTFTLPLTKTPANRASSPI